MRRAVFLLIFCVGTEVLAGFIGWKLSSAFASETGCEDVLISTPAVQLVLQNENNHQIPSPWTAARVSAVIHRMSLDLAPHFKLPGEIEVILKSGASGDFFKSHLDENRIYVSDRLRIPQFAHMGAFRDNPPLVAHEYGHLIMTWNLSQSFQQTNEAFSTEIDRLEKREATLLSRPDPTPDDLDVLRIYQNFRHLKTSNMEFLYESYSELIADFFAVMYADRPDAISRAMPTSSRDSLYRDFSVPHRVDPALIYAVDSSKKKGTYYVFAPARTALWNHKLKAQEKAENWNREARARFTRKAFDIMIEELNAEAKMLMAGSEIPPLQDLNKRLLDALNEKL